MEMDKRSKAGTPVLTPGFCHVAGNWARERVTCPTSGEPGGEALAVQPCVLRATDTCSCFSQRVRKVEKTPLLIKVETQKAFRLLVSP